ncbi:Indoleamine 2,3-dioxygenase [Mrakia frigida]|uniref:dioxygenase BNA2 n=1 Tax=Mrakia frigida TaxID=29902 RepID=UPI003FCC2280
MSFSPHSLPSGHFLSLAPTFTSSLTNPSSSSLAPSTSTLASADFEVDVRTGFLPGEPGLSQLPREYAVWERLLEEAKEGAVKVGGGGEEGSGDRWRSQLEQMPILLLPPHHLNSQILHLSAVTLTFLLHFYVHSHAPPTSSLSIPASLSKPLLQVSTLLGLPPILTYATTVLWNVIPTHTHLTFDVHSNRPTEVHHTFTGLESERQFYLVSSLIEIHGVKALGIMRAALDEAFVGDALALRRITAYLRSLSGAIDELTEVMAGMKQSGCDPAEFYWLIRPWFKGSDAEGPGGLGWLFEGVGEEGEGERRSVSGPSAGQSSIVHALDIFLGIDHSPAKKEGDKAADATFMERMLQYMPGPHRRFLLHLQAGPTIRDLVLANPDFAGGDLTRAFDETVTTMGRFRDGHMKIVTQYIISQARKPPPPHFFPLTSSSSTLLTTSLPSPPPKSTPLASESWTQGSEKLPAQEEVLRGTGGSDLQSFLVRCKEKTVATLIRGERSE